MEAHKISISLFTMGLALKNNAKTTARRRLRDIVRAEQGKRVIILSLENAA